MTASKKGLNRAEASSQAHFPVTMAQPINAHTHTHMYICTYKIYTQYSHIQYMLSVCTLFMCMYTCVYDWVCVHLRILCTCMFVYMYMCVHVSMYQVIRIEMFESE